MFRRTQWPSSGYILLPEEFYTLCIFASRYRDLITYCSILVINMYWESLGGPGARTDALSGMPSRHPTESIYSRPRASQIFPIHISYQYRGMGDEISTSRRRYA